MKTVLMVDDELDKLAADRLELEDRGFRVLVADTATEALEVLRTDTVDLVLLDVMMPYHTLDELLELGIERVRAAPLANVTTGVRFCFDARKIKPGLPIVILSWLAEGEIRQRAANAGLDMPANVAFFQKGVDNSEQEIVEIERLLLA